MKSLYAYYGLIDIHDIDSPGHSLYQMGLIDSISETFGVQQFDFYSYYPVNVIESANVKGFPDTELGRTFLSYRKCLLNAPIHDINVLIDRIRAKEYDTLYLKARFRNLSALAKKWKDAKEFEDIIDVAVSCGYSKKQIVILDTDLSLSAKVMEKLEKVATILIPSIDFPGVSNRFLMDCVEANTKTWDNNKQVGSVFYGNLDASKYKKGNAKSPVLPSVISWVESYHSISQNKDPFYVVCKESDFNTHIESMKNTRHIDRRDRESIWSTLESSTIMLNVTKEKYNERRFIPARIYEAMLFGMIPVSYKFEFLCPSFSFETIDDLSEIYKYLFEIEPTERLQAYGHFILSYTNYVKSSK